MNAEIEVRGIEEVKRNMAKLAARYSKEVAQAANQGGELVRSAAIKSIQNQSQGQTVTRTRAGGGEYEHVASAPGDAPNTDTGRLVSSIQVERRSDDVYVGSTLEYAGQLEFGTRRTAPRPWLNPALESQRNNIKKLFKAATDKVGGDV